MARPSLVALLLTACAASDPSGVMPADGGGGRGDAGADLAPAPDASPATDGAAPADGGPLARPIVAVTFNTGTNPGMDHDDGPDDGYGSEEAKLSDEHYGDGLAWRAAIEDARAFLATVKPDVIGFQEIFHPGECPSVPADARKGFVCESWTSGDPTVAQLLLGAGYQVACHLRKPDKCLGVKQSFGTIRGCAGALCLDGLAGAEVKGCGGGSRGGRAVVDLAGGGEITVVNVHGSSGFAAADSDCRKKQFEQVFVDLDGAPAASGARNIVLGDFNTDPGRLTLVDGSAAELVEHVGGGKKFHFVTEAGSGATPTYDVKLLPFLPAGFNIDHVISDAFTGTCWAAGVTAGHPPVTQMVYFDHKPIVCALSPP